MRHLVRFGSDGVWRPAPATSEGSFSAVNPATGRIPDEYPGLPNGRPRRRAPRGSAASSTIWPALDPDRLADFLEGFAARLEAGRDEIVAMAHSETALPERAAPPLGRISPDDGPAPPGGRVPAGSGLGASRRSIRSADSGRCTGRSAGPSSSSVRTTFPSPTIPWPGRRFRRGHRGGQPGHRQGPPLAPRDHQDPRRVAFDALAASGLPPALVQMVYHCRPEDGLKLVAHPLTGATGIHREPRFGDSP